MLQEQSSCALGDLKFNNLINSYSVPGRMNMGESLTSISDLIHKFGRMENNTASANGFHFSIFSPNISLTIIPAIQFLSYMYVLQRGSAKYCSDVNYTSGNTTELLQSFGPQLGRTERKPLLDLDNIMTYGQAHSTRSCPNSMINIPYYSTDTFYPVTGQNGYAPSDDTPYPGASMHSRNANIFNGYVSAGTDFMFAYLIPPPIGL